MGRPLIKVNMFCSAAVLSGRKVAEKAYQRFIHAVMRINIADHVVGNPTAIPNMIAQNNFAFFIAVLTWKLVAIAFMQSENRYWSRYE